VVFAEHRCHGLRGEVADVSVVFLPSPLMFVVHSEFIIVKLIWGVVPDDTLLAAVTLHVAVLEPRLSIRDLNIRVLINVFLLNGISVGCAIHLCSYFY
jgi:hypothetical protein